MTPCPKCSSPLEGLATFCHRCEAYTEDMVEGEAKVARVQLLGIREAEISKGQGLALLGIEQAASVRNCAQTPPDTRPESEIRLAIRRALETLDFVVIDFEQGFRKDGSTRVRKGLPDLYIMGFGVGVWRELKAAKGRLTPEQEAFGDDCRRCGIDWAVWRHETDAIEWAREAREAAA